MCPTEAQAHEIYTLLRENWTYYQSVLPHIEEKLWIDHCVPDWIGTEDYYIEMRSGGYGIYYEHTEKNYHKHRYLLQITKDSDWLVKEPQGIYTIIAASGKGSEKGNIALLISSTTTLTQNGRLRIRQTEAKAEIIVIMLRL